MLPNNACRVRKVVNLLAKRQSLKLKVLDLISGVKGQRKAFGQLSVIRYRTPETARVCSSLQSHPFD